MSKKLIQEMDQREDEVLDLYINMLYNMSSSMFGKIKKKDPRLFAEVLREMASVYARDEEFAKIGI